MRGCWSAFEPLHHRSGKPSGTSCTLYLLVFLILMIVKLCPSGCLSWTPASLPVWGILISAPSFPPFWNRLRSGRLHCALCQTGRPFPKSLILCLPAHARLVISVVVHLHLVVEICPSWLRAAARYCVVLCAVALACVR